MDLKLKFEVISGYVQKCYLNIASDLSSGLHFKLLIL